MDIIKRFAWIDQGILQDGNFKLWSKLSTARCLSKIIVFVTVYL